VKTILITGINGFLGSHLARELSSEYKIIGLEYTIENLFRIAECNYKVYAAQEDIPEAIFTDQRIDLIIHTATFYGKNNEDIIRMFNAILYSPFNLLDKAIKHGCRIFINTDTVLDRFVSTYALTKRQFQEWLFHRKNEIKVINMQLEHFYGPGASDSNFITAMMHKLKKHESPINLTPGDQQRDFLFIDDVVSAFLTVINNQSLIPEEYSSFQVCSNQRISIRDLMILMKELTGSNSKLNFGAVPYRENELMQSTTNNVALRLLGWKPACNIIEGLKRTSTNM